jgi:hypothetical protein
VICDVENITNDGKAFGTWWEITGGSPSKSDYEPEDEANERSWNEVTSHAVTAMPTLGI